MTGSIVASQPDVAEVDRRIGELGEERREYERWARARGDEHIIAMQTHAEAIDKALAADTAPPPEPRPAWPVERHHDEIATLIGRERQLADERQRAVAACAPDVRAAARQEVEQALDEARHHVQALDSLARRVGAARAAMIDVESAVDTVSGRFRRLDWGRSPQAADVLAAILDGRDLLEPGQSRAGLGFTKHEVPDPQPAPEPGRPGAGAGAALAGRGRGVQR